MRTEEVARYPLLATLPYAATIFLSSFLLFLVQPIIAKQILPWFGGSAGVWTTCLVFFQSVLLAGYAYADWTTRLGPRRQAYLHVAILAVSLACLPIIASSGWKPQGNEEPIARILLLLCATIGLPYFLLSTTTPLLQAWYWRRFQSAVPYRLFALSNFASLLALLGFPLLFEPSFDLKQLGWGWSFVYGGFAVLCGAVGLMSANGADSRGPAAPRASPPALDHQLLWLGLAAMGSVMLLAVTNHITQNISSVPFLWVLPLALYLITFILAFDHPRWYVRPLFVVALLILVPAMAYYVPSLDLRVAAPLYLIGLFVTCMFCHGELAHSKPDPAHLTRFYLMISLGGALGAVLVAIVAPLVLPGYFELGVTLLVLAVIVAMRLKQVALWVGIAVAVATSVLVVQGMYGYTLGMRVMERDFYGVVRTGDHMEPVPYRTMYHGGIMHGGQLLGDSFRNTPADYFSPNSGYGRVFTSLREMDKRRKLSVGVIGLGAGVLAAWMKPGDQLVFYEISPRVVDIAKREFTYLADTAARTEVVLGDGRLSLEREPPRGYDVLGIDAFSGDSIPMHLITREAMALYVKHLKPDGVIVFQATNRYVDLLPVVKRLASEFGMEAVNISDSPDAMEGPEYWYSATDQVIVTRNRKLLDWPRIDDASEEIEDRANLPTFTDAHHNLLRILK
ncbi:MAG: fused MFS/spermidine synthase [Betaproteobacteria bacterium]|nr:fused MFS/spermidine synthase [Betaproteobacteria bacterium]MBV9360186.1 fused MFS/spermidine synthase [Betaproteobacteria bacterium]